jgi:hypothetical protein
LLEESAGSDNERSLNDIEFEDMRKETNRPPTRPIERTRKTARMKRRTRDR